MNSFLFYFSRIVSFLCPVLRGFGMLEGTRNEKEKGKIKKWLAVKIT